MTNQRFVKNIAESQRAAFLGYGSGFSEVAFTPFWGGSTSDGSVTAYTTQFGTCRRVGDVFFIVAGLQASTIATLPSGNLMIKGFPAVIGGEASFWPFTIGYANDTDFVTCGGFPAATGVQFYDSAMTPVPGGILSVSLYVVISGVYWT